MNASKLFTAAAAFAFAASAFAADVPAASVAATSASAAQAAAAAHGIAAVGATKHTLTRAQVKAEAIEANNNRRASEAGNTDWFMK